MLTDLAVASFVMVLIMLPNYLFSTKYQEELDEMEESGVDTSEINFSKEEIKEFKKMQI